MKKLVRLLSAVILGLCLHAEAISETWAPGTAKDAAAVSARSQEILRLMDAGNLGKVWEDGSQTLQKMTTKLVFVAAIKAFRSHVGEVRHRPTPTIVFTRDMANAPAGHYAALLHDTVFKNATLEESVVLVEQDGQWRLSGYFFFKKRLGSGDQQGK
jgi:hypothetical protein